MKDEHPRQLKAVAGSGAPVAADKRNTSQFTVAEAIQKYLDGRKMKSRARKRLIGVLKHFEQFAGKATQLDQIT